MQSPSYIPIYADRYQPFVGTITLNGKDLTGCTVHGQIRPKVNATTGAVVSLAAVGSDTVTGFRVLSASSQASVIRMCVSSADVAQFTSSLDLEDVFTRYEIKIKEADGFTNNVFVYGPFVIRAGVDNV